MDNSYIIDYYNNYEEDKRLTSRYGQIEYITTMHYVHQYVKPGAKVLEVGAGTGRYSIALSREGYQVTAVELVDHNIEVFKSKLNDEDTVTVQQGNAMDLSAFDSQSFDAVLIFGPMYHLYNDEDKIKALQEAKRVTKADGYLFVAYCMNEPTVIQCAFTADGANLMDYLHRSLLTDDFHFVSEPAELFELMRTEDIERINKASGVKRIKLIGTDMFTYYIAERVNSWSDEVFQAYLKYHFSICERNDVIGLSNHTLDILQMENSTKDPYVECPTVTTKSFTIRLITKEDSESLFHCYNDKDAVARMNDDNCDFGFYVDTKEQMSETIGYWIDFYSKRYFIRFSIVDKATGTAVGTIEGFGGETGVLRVDIASAYEKTDYLTEIFAYAKANFRELFGNKVLVTKAISSATERRKALENSGWEYIGKFRDYPDYYQITL